MKIGMSFLIGAIFIGLLLFLSTRCGFLRQTPLQNTTRVRDSIVHKTDTVRITIPGGVVRVAVQDTLLVRDTVYTKDLKSGLMLRLWRDKYNQLNAECAKRDTTAKAEVKYIERFKTIENKREVPVKHIPVWVWLALGASLITLIYSFLRR